MKQTNQQRELEASNADNEETLKLEEQLREAAAAGEFLESAAGKLWTKLATEEITKIVKEISSDKYRKDLMGYNNALSDLNAYKKILRKMQVASSPTRVSKIQERLEDAG